MRPWPEPRPPLTAPSRPHAPGTAEPWRGRLHPSLPDEILWLLWADGPTASAHADRAFELTLDLRWTRSSCARIFELVLRTTGKDGTPLGTFGHVYAPMDREALKTLARLSRQPWWHLVVVGPDGDVAAAVELRNTLGLEELLRGAG